MPNWCLNKLEVTSDPEDADKLKALMFNPKTEELDFGLAVPFPQALCGMLIKNENQDGIEFNKALDSRTSQLDTTCFISALRGVNANKEEVSCRVKYLICSYINETSGDDVPDVSSDDISNEEALKAERELINVLEKDLMSTPCYSHLTPVEDIIEYFLNINEYKTDEDSYIYFITYMSNARGDCPLSIRYAIATLEGYYEDECMDVYGCIDAVDWTVDHWGTKWNAYYSIISKDYTEVVFDTAWSPPVDWLRSLTTKAEKEGIRDFSAILSYGEGGMWFGGKFFISSTGDYIETSYSSEEIEEFLNNARESIKDPIERKDDSTELDTYGLEY